MVHRPSDSRLLVNLLSHEKEYSKQLNALFDHSQSSLASFSAYASASAPPTSQIIIQVAGALAGADEALRRYAESLERWQEQLKSLRDLEDEVGHIMRDREILVTRLIKVSKSQKSTRDSILASSSTSTLSFAKAPEVQTSTKLASAQSELQACEAHLAAKERQLDAMRTEAMKNGLSTRCKALVECGWTWGEMGKEGLRALESLENTFTGNGAVNGVDTTPLNSPPIRPYNRPLPDGPPSDLSSIGPSQSASQTTHGYSETVASANSRLYIPPAHLISDNTFPTEIEEEPGEGSSAEENDEGAYEVRENERFATGKKRESKREGSVKPKNDRSAQVANGHANTAEPSPPANPVQRNRRTSTSVLGTIAAFFHHKSASDSEQRLAGPSGLYRPSGKWHTRTDKNLTHIRKGKGRANDSDDDVNIHPIIHPPRPSPLSGPPGIPGTSSEKRLKKRGRANANTKQLRAPSPPRMSSAGPATANGLALDRSGKAKGREEIVLSPSEGLSNDQNTPNRRVKRRKSGNTGRAQPNGVLPAVLPTETSLLSRDNSLSKRSITSAASAPVIPNASRDGAKSTGTPPYRRESTHRRAASIDLTPTRADTAAAFAAKGHKKVLSNSGYPTLPARAGTLPSSHHERSLMSIVEGVSRHNRESRAQQDPNKMLIVAKAPPPIHISVEDELLSTPTQTHASPSTFIPPVSPLRVNKAKDKTPSERSLPLTPSASAPNIQAMHQPSSPDLKPLRSAMRNTSRSPSPQKISLPAVSLPAPVRPAKSKLRPPATPVHASVDLPEEHPVQQEASTVVTNGRDVDNDDVSSISSYETTQEVIDDDADEEDNAATPNLTPTQPTGPPVPPPKSPSPILTNGSQVSHSTSSNLTATDSNGMPTRRKSVRMSLPPTFSTTPPALEETDEETHRARRHEPWSTAPYSADRSSWRSRIKDTHERDTWQDSSGSEDEEYKKAKSLLSRFSSKSKHR